MRRPTYCHRKALVTPIPFGVSAFVFPLFFAKNFGKKKRFKEKKRKKTSHRFVRVYSKTVKSDDHLLSIEAKLYRLQQTVANSK